MVPLGVVGSWALDYSSCGRFLCLDATETPQPNKKNQIQEVRNKIQEVHKYCEESTICGCAGNLRLLSPWLQLRFRV